MRGTGNQRVPSLVVTAAVTHARHGGISVVTMDDGKVNAVNDALVEGLNAALDEARGARAVVLAGRPGVFSAGFDLGVLGEGGPGADALVRRGRDLLVRLYSSPVPVVAACTGHAVALGGVVLLACDYRVGATGDVRIGLNEVAIGRPMPPLLLRLAEQRLNAARRTEAVLLARIWTPQEAVDVGFTDEVVALDEVVPTALSRAQDLGTRLQPDAFAETSRRMRTAATTDV